MTGKTIRKGMTKRQRLHHAFLVDLMRQVTFDLHHQLESGLFALPPAWQEIADRRTTPGKERMTIRIDRDVVKFFRATGAGFQTRMNDVLRAFMHARISGMIEDASRFEDYVDDMGFEDRPQPGDFERDLERLKRRRAQRGDPPDDPSGG